MPACQPAAELRGDETACIGVEYLSVVWDFHDPDVNNAMLLVLCRELSQSACVLALGPRIRTTGSKSAEFGFTFYTERCLILTKPFLRFVCAK